MNRPLPNEKNKKVIGIMKKELGRKIMKKSYSYFKDDGSKDKKAKETKRCVVKRKLKFGEYKNCLEATQLDIKFIKLK